MKNIEVGSEIRVNGYAVMCDKNGLDVSEVANTFYGNEACYVVSIWNKHYVFSYFGVIYKAFKTSCTLFLPDERTGKPYPEFVDYQPVTVTLSGEFRIIPGKKNLVRLGGPIISFASGFYLELDKDKSIKPQWVNRRKDNLGRTARKNA